MTLKLGEATAGFTIILKLYVLMSWCQFAEKKNSKGALGIVVVCPAQHELQ